MIAEAIRGPRPEGGRRPRARMGGRARARREARAVPPLGRDVRTVPLADRAARLAAVVVRDGGARRAGARGAARAPRPLPPGEPAPLRDRVARAGARPGASRASSGGGTRSRSGLPRRPPDVRRAAARRVRRVRVGASSSATRTSSTRGSPPRSGRSRRSAGRGETPELERYYPRRRQLDRARDHPALGEPDDLLRASFCSGSPVHGRDHPLDRPRPRRAADVEEPRHRHRPDGADRGARRRRDPVRPAQDLLDPGRPLRRRRDRGGPQAREQALERRAADPPADGGRRRRRAARRRSRSAGSSPGSTRRAQRSRRRGRASTSPPRPACSTTSPSTTSATGTPRRSSRGCTTATRTAARPRSPRSSGCSRCSTR